MDQKTKRDLAQAYDRVAEKYVARCFDELDHKPFDRAQLDRFAARVQGRGPVCDMGCGPGEIACYLCARGLDEVFGLDLSPEMVKQAQQLTPDIEFRQGDMLALDAPDGAWGGIAAFYSIIHIPRAEVVDALREMRRVLQPGGLLLLAFHLGQEVLHLDEWWEEEVNVDFIFFETDEMAGYLTAAGFEIEEVLERDPYAEGIEAQTRRAYIFAAKPKGDFHEQEK